MKDVEIIAKKFNNAQEFNNQLSSYLTENLKFGDKTPKEWKQYFFIKIPSEISLASIVDLSAEIFSKYQQAAVYRDKETMQLTIMEQAKVDKYHAAYQDERKEHEQKFNKTLAAKSCEVAAQLKIKELEDAISNQKVARDFWKATCDTLTELRKHIETMNWALAADARLNKDINIYGANND